MRLLPSLPIALGIAAVLASGCERRKGPGGMKPAETWNAGAAAEQPQAVDPNDPHANVNMADPHAGMAMGDPHAGMAMGDPHAGMAMGDPHAGVDMSGATGPGGLPPPDPDRPIDPSKFLRGSIRLGKGMGAKRPDGVLFLAVRVADASGQSSGPPIAVKRLAAGTFPVMFELTEADAMVAGTAFTGKVVIAARLDQDAEALSKQPGDLTGEVVATIPSEGLELTLDTILQ